MIKTFIIGIVLGAAAVAAASYYVPVVDLSRETSIVSVAANGGNVETFRVNIPGDRIMTGTADSERQLPADLRWPQSANLSGTSAELYKLRNAEDTVIGVASRVAVRSETFGDAVEWLLHFPARGSIYVNLQPQSSSGQRTGTLRAGTREFNGLGGSLTERWVKAAEATDPTRSGHIELVAQYVGRDAGTPEAGE